MSIVRRTLLGLAAASAVALTTGIAAGPVKAEGLPETITVDYAYYNPVALLIKEKGWIEEEFASDDTEIRWVLSLGSNKALEFLNGESVDFGSTAGAAAVVGKANGIPIKSVYIYSKPEWTALVTRPGTGIETVADLAGRSVAVTRGTDPHIFLLRALDQAGLTEDDINVVLLQHPDGYAALEKGQVDAWAGLDPHMAKAELEAGHTLFYRNPDLNTYGVLNVREDFAAEHPDVIQRVLQVYERGRKYALEHPDELRDVLVEAVNLSNEVAERQLSERTDLSNPIIGDEHREAWVAAGLILRDIGILKDDVNVEGVVDSLIDPSFIQSVAELQN